MNYSSLVTRKGQVTIPAPLRKLLGLKQGDTVVFRELEGRIVVQPADEAVLATAGIFRRYAGDKAPSAESLRELAADALVHESRERLAG